MIEYLEKVVYLQRFLFRGEILRQRLDQSHQQESSLETFIENVPVIAEVVPGQVSAHFARRHRRNDEHRVLRPHLARHGKSQHLKR